MNQTHFRSNMEPSKMNEATPPRPPTAHRPRRPCFIRLSEHEHLVLPLHTIPQLLINPSHLPRVLVDVEQELTPRRDDIQYRLRVLPMASHLQLPPNGNEMKILAWNCRGIARSNFLRAVGALIDRHQPHILIVMNTRHLEDGPEDISPIIRQQLPYPNSYVSTVASFWVLWNGESIIVSSFRGSTRRLHLEAMLPPQLPVQGHELIM